MGQLKRPPGWTHTDEAKAKISVKLQEHHALVRAQGIPQARKCGRCKKVKNAVKDFTWRKRKLVSGGYSYHPYPRCKACQAELARERRSKKSIEDRRADDRRWYRNRREKQRAARRQARGEVETINAVHVRAEPFLTWYDAIDTREFDWDKHPANPTKTQLRRINDARRRGTINLRIADELLTKMGRHEMVAIWWPEI